MLMAIGLTAVSVALGMFLHDLTMAGISYFVERREAKAS
jgi:hypothetical protein